MNPGKTGPFRPPPKSRLISSRLIPSHTSLLQSPALPLSSNLSVQGDIMLHSNYLTATETISLVSQNKLTITQIVQDHLARYDERDGEIHAWVHLDRERALREAERMDKIPVEERGVLHGMVLGVKDMISLFCCCILSFLLASFPSPSSLEFPPFFVHLHPVHASIISFLANRRELNVQVRKWTLTMSRHKRYDSESISRGGIKLMRTI